MGRLPSVVRKELRKVINYKTYIVTYERLFIREERGIDFILHR